MKYEVGEKLANKYNMKFYETSSINGNNVDKIFYDTTEIIFINGDNNYYNLTNNDCRITFTSRGAAAEGKKKILLIFLIIKLNILMLIFISIIYCNYFGSVTVS